MKNLLTILFAAFALIFVACEYKDDKDAVSDNKTSAIVEVCDPVCNADTETCVCKDTDTGDHVCACEAKATEECKCDDGTACPDNDKAKCVTTPVEDKCAGKAENDECDTNKTCQKSKDDKLECKDKLAE